jgi:hypothetical protein
MSKGKEKIRKKPFYIGNYEEPGKEDEGQILLVACLYQNESSSDDILNLSPDKSELPNNF